MIGVAVEAQVAVAHEVEVDVGASRLHGRPRPPEQVGNQGTVHGHHL